jgi:hypothetical protein
LRCGLLDALREGVNHGCVPVPLSEVRHEFGQAGDVDADVDVDGLRFGFCHGLTELIWPIIEYMTSSLDPDPQVALTRVTVAELTGRLTQDEESLLLSMLNPGNTLNGLALSGAFALYANGLLSPMGRGNYELSDAGRAIAEALSEPAPAAAAAAFIRR